MSSRPWAKSKPIRSISRIASRRCASIGNGPAERAAAAEPPGGRGPPRADRAGSPRFHRTGGRSSATEPPARTGRGAPRKGSFPSRSALTAAISRSITQHSLEPGQHGGEIVLRAALRHTASHSEQARDSASTRAPGSACACAQRRRISRKLARCHSPSAPAAGLGFGQQALDLRRGQVLMGDQAQRRELLGARRRPARWASSRRYPSAAPRSLARARPIRRNRSSNC